MDNNNRGNASPTAEQGPSIGQSASEEFTATNQVVCFLRLSTVSWLGRISTPLCLLQILQSVHSAGNSLHSCTFLKQTQRSRDTVDTAILRHLAHASCPLSLFATCCLYDE